MEPENNKRQAEAILEVLYHARDFKALQDVASDPTKDPQVRAYAAGLLLRPWLPWGVGRRALMVVICGAALSLAIAGYIFLAFCLMLVNVLFSPRAVGEVVALCRKPAPPQMFDLRKLRQDLAETQAQGPEVYKSEFEPVFNRLEATYGNMVPVTQLDGLRQLISSKLAGLEVRRQEIIDQGAKEGKTIEIESLRQTIEASKATYNGPDRNTYIVEVDKLMESLTVKYGSSIPVDDAYKIMQNLEAGLGHTPNE